MSSGCWRQASGSNFKVQLNRTDGKSNRRDDDRLGDQSHHREPDFIRCGGFVHAGRCKITFRQLFSNSRNASRVNFIGRFGVLFQRAH